MGENIHHQEVQMVLVSERMGHTSLTLLLELRRMKSLRACVRLTNDCFSFIFVFTRTRAKHCYGPQHLAPARAWAITPSMSRVRRNKAPLTPAGR